jgi:hypothetical protein
MRVAFILVGLIALATGCATKDPLSKAMAEDKKRCEDVGFDSGTPAMAQCMASVAQTRTAEQDRAASMVQQ